MGARLLAFASDPLVRRQLERAAAGTGSELDLRSDPTETPDISDPADIAGPPAAIVIDLEHPSALEWVGLIKQRWPQSLLAGYLSLPDQVRWTQAIDAGCDLVCSRGTLARTLTARLESWASEPGGPRLRLFSLGEVAGRIGVVARLPETVKGPLAAYHLGGEILVTADRCPHAGALLSEGEVLTDEGAISCPRHGSRFDLRSGDRLRGPADDPIETYRVVIEDGEVYVRLDLPGAASSPL